MENKQEKPKKDKGCIKCEHFWDCIGKDDRVKECLRFKERKRNEQ